MARDTELLRTVALEADTGRLSTLAESANGEDGIALTIACHPDVRRWGERAWLARPVIIDRRTPDFDGADGLGRPWPLADISVSRSQVVELRPEGEGLRIRRIHDRAPLSLDGVRLDGEARLDRRDIDRGVMLQLSHQVALWIQRERIPGRAPTLAPNIVGRSPGVTRTREDIGNVARYDFTVLVRGETGSGKELVARAIHENSTRAGGPLVAVNLGTVAPELVAAELFGHTRGAFSGATTARQGWFRSANGGTLFLDEIGEAGPEVQRALLRVLETSRVQPVGSDRDEEIDVRVVAATDADLESDIDAGRFRNPLLQRLSQYVITLPPLRERRGDIPLIARHILLGRAGELGIQSLVVPAEADRPAWIDVAAVRMLMGYDWPGNVRELINVVTRTAISCRTEARFAPPIALLAARRTTPSGGHEQVPDIVTDHGNGRSPAATGRTRRKRLTDIHTDDLMVALERHDWRPAAAAEELGIARSSVYELIRRHPSIPESTRLERDEIEQALSDAGGSVRIAARSLRVPVRGLKIRMSQLQMDDA